jgi:RimJ/RimL family protein N-acetyltransferase
MGYSNKDADDFEKLRVAFAELKKLGSVENLLEAFGLSGMPQAQRYGIFFGLVVFSCTLTAVIGLLVMGGSFKRIAEQADTGEATRLTATDQRAHRALLLERLLDGRERLNKNYSPEPTTENLTNLTKMLCNEAPEDQLDAVPKLVEDESATQVDEMKRTFPPFYEENYVDAYRMCQDRPGGKVLSGRPEAHFESYARGYAGCGPYTSLTYKRSYSRMYEAICCQNQQTNDKYIELFRTRPKDIIGKYVRLEALQVERHLTDLYRVTSGQPALENQSFDPEEVWSFQDEGPFASEDEMRLSFVFQHKKNDAAFAIVHSVTDRVIGVILLTNDNPKNLSIQLECPIVQPAREGSAEQLEASFLLMDRLFAFGYRRIQISIDSQDVNSRKWAVRLNFTLEGLLFKHMVSKESSRDSNIYSMLNSDWTKGARGALFSKLYGKSAYNADAANEQKEEEFAEQWRVLEEQKRLEEVAKDKNP